MFLLSFLNHNEHSNNNAFDVCQYFLVKVSKTKVTTRRQLPVHLDIRFQKIITETEKTDG